MGVFFVMVERSSVNVMRILIGLTVAVGVSAVAIAKPTASLTSNFELEGLIRDPIKLHVESADGRRVMLDAFVTRPAGQGRWPVALLTHGTDGTFQQDKLELNPNRLSSAAITFARHGYAAVVVLRQGYGRSSGVTDYQGNSCATPRHHRAGKLARDDILIALRAIARQPWAAADKTILAGLSAGGFAVLAAGATNPAGVRAVINLDGGATDQANAAICGKAELLAALQSYGATAQTPTLWIYAENDKSFPPRLARDMFDRYHNAGGRLNSFKHRRSTKTATHFSLQLPRNSGGRASRSSCKSTGCPAVRS
jgi:dienelactone hydrolase